MTGETHAARYLIRGERIYDHDGDIHQPAIADLLIRDGIIERIAPQIAADGGVEVVDAAGKLVAPGFVNAHYHSHDVMAKGLFEEMPFDIWMLHSNPASYGRRSHEEVRVRTLIGAAESLRNGITTIQDFLTVVPPDEAYVDTVLSAYEEAGIRVVFAIAARDRAALDIAPFIPKNLPDSIRKRLAGQDRSAPAMNSTLCPVRLGGWERPLPNFRPGRSPRLRPSGARPNCSKASRRCRASTDCRSSPMSAKRASRRPRHTWDLTHQSR